MASNRREWVGAAVDAVMTYWLEGMNIDPDSAESMADWWASGEAPDAALEIVYRIRDALSVRGWDIVKREADRDTVGEHEADDRG